MIQTISPNPDLKPNPYNCGASHPTKHTVGQHAQFDHANSSPKSKKVELVNQHNP